VFYIVLVFERSELRPLSCKSSRMCIIHSGPAAGVLSRRLAGFCQVPCWAPAVVAGQLLGAEAGSRGSLLLCQSLAGGDGVG